MLAEAKSLRLGKFVAYLRKENKELQARVVPSSPLEHTAKRISAIEGVATEIAELEKEAQTVAKDIT